MDTLYTLDRDGTIAAFDWHRVLDSIPIPPDLRSALWARFGDSQQLERRESSEQDAVLDRLAGLELSVSENNLRAAVIGRIDAQFPSTPNDITVYNSSMFLALDEGIAQLQLLPDGSIARQTFADQKVLDIPSVGLSASYNTLAIAAGRDGVWEVPIPGTLASSGREMTVETAPPRQHPIAASVVSWLYYSVLASSFGGPGTLLDYSLHRFGNQTERVLDEILPSEAFLGTGAPTWGLRDRLYTISDGTVVAYQYRPGRHRSISQKLSEIGHERSVAVPVIAAGATTFGAVLESTDQLIIVDGTGEHTVIPVEPIQWRVFPQSRRYTTQLHVVRTDHLEIWSFSVDEELGGFAVSPGFTTRRRR